jgi:uncharacterized protein (TIGR03437 family)
MNRILVLLAAGATTAAAYVPNPVDATQFYRTDFASIQFLANQNIAAGLMNAQGQVWITADSAPTDAINGAIAAWNGVTTTSARFAPVQTTTLIYNQRDGNDVITFTDDAYTRTTTAGTLALTVISYPMGQANIVDSDIIFDPVYQFSTTGAAGTYDLQSVLTHELGHSLGANHTNILSATMFYAVAMQDTHERALSADDIAFVSALYPANGGNGYGVISGTATIGGAPLMGGAIAAVDPNTGITVGGFSSVTDGSFSFQIPPGNYYVYVEPALNLALYGLTGPAQVFTSFEAGFAGGNAQPSLVQVTAGATATVSLTGGAGVSPILRPFSAISLAGGTADYHGLFYKSSFTVSSGQSVDFLFGNPLTATITENNIQLLGPATLRPGSLRRDSSLTLSDGTQVFRFTLDIPPLAANGSSTLVFKNGTDILTLSGVLNFTRPQAVNAASFLGGPIAPGEILSFFGSQLGPASPVSNGGFDANGLLPASLGGVTVSFGATPAPLFYVSGSQINLQVPYEISGQTSMLMTVAYNGSTVAQSTLSVGKSAPGIFVVTNADGSVNGPGAPSSAGSVLVIFGTGTGNTSGLVQTGAAAPANSMIAATATIGGRAVTPIYAGLTAGSVGLSQVNVTIPPGTPVGDAVPLQVSMNSVASQTVNISVR